MVLLSSDFLVHLLLRIDVPLLPGRYTYAGVLRIVRVPPTLNSGLEAVHAAASLQVRLVPAARLLHWVGGICRAVWWMRAPELWARFLRVAAFMRPTPFPFLSFCYSVDYLISHLIAVNAPGSLGASGFLVHGIVTF